jgi:hypothetical protein
MNCLVCSRDLDAERPAVAVCASCGGAVCNAHACIRCARRPVGPGSEQIQTTSLRSRTVRCLVCVQASEGSVADQAARALRADRFRNFWSLAPRTRRTAGLRVCLVRSRSTRRGTTRPSSFGD